MDLAGSNSSFEPQTPGIILGIDVGTTSSGVSFALLWPDRTPSLQTVTRFTDQNSGDSKIPSIMYYDRDGDLMVAGASAVTETAINNAEFEEWTKVERFKMHLRPCDLEFDVSDVNLGPLPPSRTAVEVMGDFLRYLYEETANFIRTHFADGKDLWEGVKLQRYFALSLPNGWDDVPQQRMRQAAIHGGLIADSHEDHARVRFISEGEASVSSCLVDDQFPIDISPSHRFILCDAGGSTLQVTPYEISKIEPLRLEELAPSICCFSGSVSVNARARDLLEKKLRGSRYDNPDSLDDIIGDGFEYTTKREFSDSTKVGWLRLGSRAESNPNLGIRKGSLRLDGTELANCFEQSVSEALASIKQQIASCGGKPMPVWLVGGFGASPWLFKKLKQSLARDAITVHRPDIDLSKAVANGSVFWLMRQLPCAYVTKCTYGTVHCVPYSPYDPEHVRRGYLNVKAPDGRAMVPSEFIPISFRDIEVRGKLVVRKAHEHTVLSKENAMAEVKLYCYCGELPAPQWYDENQDMFRLVCTMQADLSNLCRPDSLIRGENGRFWRLVLEIEITITLGSVEARLKWEEDGETKYGPMSVFFEED